MAEWSKAPDSKSGNGQLFGGSNPSLSANSMWRAAQVCANFSQRSFPQKTAFSRNSSLTSNAPNEKLIMHVIARDRCRPVESATPHLTLAIFEPMTDIVRRAAAQHWRADERERPEAVLALCLNRPFNRDQLKVLGY